MKQQVQTLVHRIKKKGDKSVNIVNIIHIGDETYRFDELPKEMQSEIQQRLNMQALESIGYKMQKAST